MNGFNEKIKRIECLYCNIGYLKDIRKVKTLREMANESGINYVTLNNILKVLRTKEDTLDEIEIYIEQLAIRDGKTKFYACNGQLTSQGERRSEDPDPYRELEKEIAIIMQPMYEKGEEKVGYKSKWRKK